MSRRLPLVVGLALAAACSAPGTRESVPPAGDGWIELVVRDHRVPADPVSDAEGRPRPPPCRIELGVGGATLLSRGLRPAGAGPPYSVEATFRFRLAPGRHLAALYYSGCRTHGDQLDSLETEMPIEVGPGRVTRLRFDGVRFEAYPPLQPSEVAP